MATAPAAMDTPTPRRDIRTLLTEQLRIVLEQRSVRIAVIAFMLSAAALIALVPTPIGVDSGWMFIVPVAVSAIAAGLGEGVLVALAASALCAATATLQLGRLSPAVVISVVTARFALYGITAVVLGAFAEAHYAVQSNLRRLARVDPLTKVFNITSFYEELGLLEETETAFALLLVDVDRLKLVNDRFGHQVGSSAIQLVAKVLKRVVRSSDCVARYGGDEFVVILRDSDRAGAQIVTNRVNEMLQEEPILGAGDHRVRVSIGTAIYGDDGSTSEELLAAADTAMYVDKRSHKLPSRSATAKRRRRIPA
jgi:diguanylate cyclase (GGDEF)-like protein